jgi:hypothetical protein
MSNKKPFTDLMGTRIIIKNFAVAKEEGEEPKKASSIILLPDDQKVKDAEETDAIVSSTQRFTIIQVGEECNPKYKAGQEVYIEKPERVLLPENSEPIVEDGEILGFIVPERMIAGIY